jgi:hypothetical protein
MPVWLVFGVQSRARVTVTGAAPGPPPPAAGEDDEDEQAAKPPPTIAARADASAIRETVRRMLIASIVSWGVTISLPGTGVESEYWTELIMIRTISGRRRHGDP